MPRLKNQRPALTNKLPFSRERVVVPEKEFLSASRRSRTSSSLVNALVKPGVVFATGNDNKILETQSVFKEITLIPQADLQVSEIEETGATLLENAILKARNAAEHTGLPAIGDDSGLFVPELGNLPGLYSARFAGQGASDRDNCEKLLELAMNLQGEQRQAFYISTVVFLRYANDPLPLVATASWQGYLHHRIEGDMGYGYDSIFYVPEFSRTAASLNLEQKQTLSNRLDAFNQLETQMNGSTGFVRP